MASISDIDPKCRGANLGAVMTAQGLGAIVGAPIGAFMYEKMQPVGFHLHLGISFGRYSPLRRLCCLPYRRTAARTASAARPALMDIPNLPSTHGKAG